MKKPISSRSFYHRSFLAWGLVVIFALIPLIAWFIGRDFEVWFSYTGFMNSFGKISGLAAMALYALSLLLMTRLRILERLFGGLNRVYIAHHIVGGLSMVLVLLHALTLVLERAATSLQEGALLLIPNGLTPVDALVIPTNEFHGAVLEQWAIFMGVVSLLLMVSLLLVTIFIKLPYRIWLITHKLMGVVFVLIAFHTLFITSDTTDNAFIWWFMVICIIIGLFSYIYKTLLGQVTIRKYRYTVASVRELPANVIELTLTPVKKAVSYDAGQFLFMRFIDKGSGLSHEWHPFSISSSPHEQTMQVCVKALGDYTATLKAAQPGMTVQLEGAYGKFSYTNFSNRDQIWIAGGIGITPFLSMLKSLPVDGYYRTYLFYSVKSESELIDWPLLYTHMMIRPNSVRVIPFIADSQGGFLDARYIEQVAGPLAGREYYLCGPPPMMRSLKAQLRARGVSKSNIHSEEFAMSEDV